MDQQAYDVLIIVQAQLDKIKNAQTLGATEEALIIDMHASIRTLLKMYQPLLQDEAAEKTKEKGWSFGK